MIQMLRGPSRQNVIRPGRGPDHAGSFSVGSVVPNVIWVRSVPSNLDVKIRDKPSTGFVKTTRLRSGENLTRPLLLANGRTVRDVPSTFIRPKVKVGEDQLLNTIFLPSAERSGACSSPSGVAVSCVR